MFLIETFLYIPIRGNLIFNSLYSPEPKKTFDMSNSKMITSKTRARRDHLCV